MNVEPSHKADNISAEFVASYQQTSHGPSSWSCYTVFTYWIIVHDSIEVTLKKFDFPFMNDEPPQRADNISADFVASYQQTWRGTSYWNCYGLPNCNLFFLFLCISSFPSTTCYLPLLLLSAEPPNKYWHLLPKKPLSQLLPSEAFEHLHHNILTEFCSSL